jgi:CheY-like chemotaxis protein
MVQRPSVLVVDDEPMVCTFMQHVLEGRGYHVWRAHGGGDALEILVKHGHELSLLVTDVLMPDISGLALARAARQSFPDLPVLYVSGYHGNYGGKVPASARMGKPFTAVEFLGHVEALVAPAGNVASVH